MSSLPDAGRVTTGLAKGCRLASAGSGTRPLSDRVKQAMFATLEAGLGEAWPGPFLDLFAGSGAAGIEALSRSAPRVLFVERDPAAARVIEQNLRRARLTGGEVLRYDALKLLAAGPDATRGVSAGVAGSFVAALVDPPYADPQSLSAALADLGHRDRRWLADGALVVAKHFWRDAPPDEVGTLRSERRRRFGETALSYYRNVRDSQGADGP